MNRFITTLFVTTLLLCTHAGAQNLFSPVQAGSPVQSSLKLATGALHPAYIVAGAALRNKLTAAPYDAVKASVISLPMPDGTQRDFKVWQTKLLPDALAAKYPALKTFSAVAIGASYITAKLDLTTYGFHAMVYNGPQTFLIDSYDDSTSVLHYKKDEQRPFAEHMKCLVPGHGHVDVAATERGKHALRTSNGNELRTYRLALACDHQYAQAATGLSSPTTAQVLSKMVTTINRINGVYERELSVTLTLVPNEDALIYTDSATDPFGGYDQLPSLLLSTNQQICDSTIGSANYDIGHIFSTGGGGLSQLACVCQDGLKAQSVTGSASPTGDGFDIDYVAHEMGHELGSMHTFNNNLDGSCFGNAAEEFAFQPGSGSTIMDYAGICGPDDLQPHSDAYFSGSSLLQIYDCITTTGDVCAVKSPTDNLPVSLPAFTANYSIPLLTPFELTAPTATDSVTDTANTYCWEQWNLGDFGMELKNTFYSGPIFRSFSPDTSSTRVFPNMTMVLADSLSNAGTENAEGEKAPDVARFLTFRLTVRDILNGTGSFLIPDDTVHLDVINTTVGFRVTSQQAAGDVYPGNISQTVTWDIAQTNVAPISADSVDIYVSADGGKTWAYYVGRYANTGSADIIIPNATTTKARIKVKGANNVFFNVNTADFSIVFYPGHTGDAIIFPIPAHDVLNVFTGIAGTVHAYIYNIAGKRVWDGTITDVGKIDISLLPRGMYFMKLGNAAYPDNVKKFMLW